MFKLKEQQRAAFFSLSENRCLPASTLKPEEREFVVDSGASMHVISKKDLSNAEMDILTKSCSPTIVITANGEVQTHAEAIVYVKELGIFLTMKVLENTPGYCKKVDPHREEALLGGNAHSTRYGETIHDRTEKPVSMHHQEQAYSENFISSWTVTQQNL